MSDYYYDNKGIKHNSEGARDQANRQYVRDEQAAARDIARLTREIAETEAKRLNLEKLRVINEAAHHEFTKDIQWLERSDPRGKLDFLVKKIMASETKVDVLVEVIWSIVIKNTVAEEDVRRVREEFIKLAKAKAELEDAKARARESQRKLIPKKTPRNYGCSIILAVFGIPLLGASCETLLKKYKEEGQIDGALLVTGFLGGILLLIALRFFGKRSQVPIDNKEELERELAGAEKELLTAESRFSGLFPEAVRLRDTMFVPARDATVSLLERRPMDYDITMCSQIAAEKVQADYPPLCRYQFTSASAAELEAAFKPLVGLVKEKVMQYDFSQLEDLLLGNEPDPVMKEGFKLLCAAPESSAQTALSASPPPPPLP
jgi:hypothetical protein